MSFSLLLLGVTLTQNSFALDDYDFISEWSSFGIEKDGYLSHPQSLAVDSKGNVYVTDWGNKRVQKFSSNGEFLNAWGKSGKLSGEFHYPSGISVDDNSVFVTDRDLHRIQKFDHDGNFISGWGTKGIHEGQFLFPNGILVSDNFVYVVDTGNQRIQKFTTDGEFISSFGSSGMGKGQFLTAIGIDVDSKGKIYVTDRGNGKIEKFDSDGNHLESLKYHKSNYDFSPTGIALDYNDEIFVTNSGNDRILHLKQDSLDLDIFDQIGPYPDVFLMPSDVDLGINGELIILDSAMHKIQTFETEFYLQPKNIEIKKTIESEVKIRDYVKPKIIAPPDMVIEATDFLTYADFGEPITSDESGIKTVMNNAPDGLPLGVTTIMWIAFDNAGNSAHSFQTITVNACGKFHSDYNRIHGTEQDDTIQGTNLDDLIFALGGNDVVNAGNGNDCVFGGDGNDVLYGNEGYDTIDGNDGDDILKGFSGNDILYGNEGHDVIDGGADRDNCYGYKRDLTINCES